MEPLSDDLILWLGIVVFVALLLFPRWHDREAGTGEAPPRDQADRDVQPPFH
ncbi:hypothetical protein C7444_12060 [Sphaerotilus hippei]|uniref:Uncharacterized protein n=1 Tax=Sphaerotilus hippei TaxID=744406 RepID=A0A318GVW4_9BURK|nr:hypothetical protein [Sphaerotilus hippei]PXW93408.1 hypothetical protein C7444_12060 [Sphaerotilus hippei]